MKTLLLSVACILSSVLSVGAQQPVESSGPALLTYDEVNQLYQQDVPPAPLNDKLKRLLTTPFVSNAAFDAGVRPMKPNSPQLGKFLRVAEWNIERGLEFDAVRLAFTDPQAFALLMDQKGSKSDPGERKRIAEQIDILRQADVIILNEVDWGVNRTLFRNVAADLAAALQMNYEYGVEFVEVDPVTMGIDEQVIVREVKEAYDDPGESKTELLDHVRQIMKPDPARYRGLHGTAILSRYRLQDVRVVPFRFQGHDWYADEKRKASELSKVEGKLSADVFKEQLVREVRRGGRMMMLADIVDPGLPSGRITVVATHLEDLTTPANRRRQLDELLDAIKDIDYPVIVAGDMNTSTHNAAPLSVTRALKQRFGSGRWWTEEAVTETVRRATPLGWAYDASLGVIGPPVLPTRRAPHSRTGFAPHFGRTLKELNESIPDRISDHNPITVDLPLTEP